MATNVMTLAWKILTIFDNKLHYIDDLFIFVLKTT